MDRSVSAAPAKSPPGKPGAAAPEAPPPKKSKKLMFIVLTLVAIVAAGGGAARRLLELSAPAPAPPAGPAPYNALAPGFGRNKLLLLFGQQTSQQLTGRNGKEQLQAQALAEVKKTLRAQHAANQVEALLFTSIVIQ